MLLEAGDSPEMFLDFFRSRGYAPRTFREERRRFEPTTYEALTGVDDYLDVLFARGAR